MASALTVADFESRVRFHIRDTDTIQPNIQSAQIYVQMSEVVGHFLTSSAPRYSYLRPAELDWRNWNDTADAFAAGDTVGYANGTGESVDHIASVYRSLGSKIVNIYSTFVLPRLEIVKMGRLLWLQKNDSVQDTPKLIAFEQSAGLASIAEPSDHDETQGRITARLWPIPSAAVYPVLKCRVVSLPTPSPTARTNLTEGETRGLAIVVASQLAPEVGLSDQYVGNLLRDVPRDMLKMFEMEKRVKWRE